MWVPLLRPFPGNEAHELFSGGPKWGVLGGGQQKVYVEKVFVLFLSPTPFFFLQSITGPVPKLSATLQHTDHAAVELNNLQGSHGTACGDRAACEGDN